MNVSLKKLWNDYGIGLILLAIAVIYGIIMLFTYLSNKGITGYETNQNMQQQYNDNLDNNETNITPSEPLGQNNYGVVTNIQTTNDFESPQTKQPQQVQSPNDLLPTDNNSQWAQLNPLGKGDLSDINLLKAGHHIGIDTVGQSLRNANLQLRSEPANPQVNTGPWNQSTIEPNLTRATFEIGSQ